LINLYQSKQFGLKLINNYMYKVDDIVVVNLRLINLEQNENNFNGHQNYDIV